MSPPTAPDAPGPAPRGSPDSLSARFREIAERKPPDPPGKGIALAAIGLLVIGGLVWTSVRGGPVKARMEAERRNAEARAEAESLAQEGKPAPVPPLALPEPERAAPAPAPAAAPASGGPAVPAPPSSTPAIPSQRPPEMTSDGGLVVGHVSELVDRILSAPPEQRPNLRRAYLGFFAATVGDPRWRRTILVEAARLAPDAVPEEAEAFALLVENAAGEALNVPGDAAAALLLLGSLRDRGGAEAQAAVERLVLSGERALELRVAAARALTAEARVRVAKTLSADPRTHPALLAALR